MDFGSGMKRLIWVGSSKKLPAIHVYIELRCLITILIGDRVVPSVYWQLTDPDFSLLEIGLERETGLIRKISVALYRGIIGTCENPPSQLEEHGIPIFDLTGSRAIVGSTVCDYEEAFGRIRVDQSPNGWQAITLFDEPRVFQLTVPDLLRFGFNERKELCEFSVNLAARDSNPGGIR